MSDAIDKALDWLYERIKHWRKGYVWLLLGLISWALAFMVFAPIVILIKVLVGKF